MTDINYQLYKVIRAQIYGSYEPMTTGGSVKMLVWWSDHNQAQCM